MNTNTSSSWDEFGTKLNGLGLKLKLHIEQSSSDDHDVTDALRDLASSIEGAFEGLRKAAKDPAIKDDVRDIGSALSQAISKTLAEVGNDIRNVRSHEHD